jgi:hypothetical protein
MEGWRRLASGGWDSTLEVPGVKWTFLFFLVIASAAQGEGTYYYCSSSSTYHATQYFSDVFTAPYGTDIGTIKNGFIAYLTVHYNESLAPKAHCVVSMDLRSAGVAQDKEELEYTNLRWRMILTHWKY